MVEKSIIERIENLRIGQAPRSELILTYLALKPAAQFNIWGNSYNGSWRKVQDIPPHVIDDLVKTLDETGLPYKIAEAYRIDKLNPIFEMLWPLLKYLPREAIEKIPKISYQEQPVYVAQDIGTLNRLLNAKSDRDHREYGRLMGYPETAIQAFLGETERLRDRPDEIDGSISPILWMVLSKSNYQQELELLRKWSEALRTHAPNLDKEIRNNFLGMPTTYK
ncbi:hypothetical protein HYU06_03780 [Candidatus Woesearchaeota archaeon]|nr:hypothetical protein [Candidatus Woesearchaeota archaeon]